MNTNLETQGDVTVIEVLSETIDSLNSEDLKSELSALAAEHPKQVLDLQRIGFLDSSGCGALVTAQKRCREAGGDLRLCNLTGTVRTVLEVSRLTRVLGVYPSRELAVAAFRK